MCAEAVAVAVIILLSTAPWRAHVCYAALYLGRKACSLPPKAPALAAEAG